MSDRDLPPSGAGDASDPPDDELLAGELVLGVLDAQQRAAAHQRAGADVQFAARVAAWERRLAPWLGDAEPVSAPAHVWLRIRSRLGWRPEPPPGLWQSLVFWRGAAILASLAAIVALWMGRPHTHPPVAVVPQATEPGARLVTTLSHDDGSAAWLASVDPAHGTVLMVPVPHGADAQGRVPELWLIPPGKAPRSLGLVSNDRAHTVTVPADVVVALGAGSVLAISLEPPGGAPAGSPTGPIIAKGAIRS